ncbi:hypothetical protein IGJ83_002777 [Enterococcus pernyi]|uniref:HTH domain-containing protein n=4 Tax=Enterococcus TaxID=1350 RepID=A0A1V2UGW0_ENTMU|nr:helix-turn-helix domain-containing protein [Enterococcus mundtii]NMP58273.1 HTH domain-containing protein [Enterococcus mundtii]ONN42581.1 hypothetical protein BTN92_09935 [Enterococcus mundtii]GKS54823.1 hypothetical protein EMLAB_14380 [Enterococcus mundtii]
MREFQLNFIMNKQTVRILRILNKFEHHASITLNNLSEVLNIPTRTIIKDIQEIKNIFNESIDLSASPSGYHFNVSDDYRYKEIKQSLLQNEPLFIMIENIFFGHLYNVPELSDQLHLSESTLLRYIKKAQSFLSEFQIKLKTSPIDFHGKEIDIRHFFHSFYSDSDITPHTVFPTLEVKEITAKITEKITLKECAPITFESFNYHLYITLIRFFNGNPIDKLPNNLVILNDEKTQLYSEVMKQTILQYFDSDISPEEKQYIYLVTLCKRSVFDEESEQIFQSIQPQPKEIEEWTNQFLELAFDTEQEKSTYSLYIRSFFLSTHLKYQLSPILLQNLADITLYSKQKFPCEYHRNETFIQNTLGETYELTLRQLEGISTSLTLLNYTLSLVHARPSKEIIFLLEGNSYIHELIQATAIKYLGHTHRLYFPNRHDTDIDMIRTKKFDILVTNYSEYLVSILMGKTTLLFDTIPTAENWNELFTLIDPNATKLYSLKDARR